MKNLGIEFYRNYIGIENPLRVDYSCSDNIMKMSGDLLGIHKEYVGLNTDNFTHPCEFEAVKPHLKLPEDLTDEEWLWVFCGEDDGDHGIRRGYSEAIIELIWDFGSYKSAVCKFDYSDNSFSQCNQEVLNRLYSLHSHPKAKEYIENGLAIKIEVKDEKQ